VGGRRPAWGRPVTVGVMPRVDPPADRAEADVVPPASAGTVSSLVPLPEILSEITASGPASQVVERSYERVIGALGAELSILEQVPVEDIARAESSLLAEAGTGLRAGKVIREAGYDGEYGVIRLFEEAELKRQTAGGLLFDLTAFKRDAQAPAAPMRSPAAETPAATPTAVPRSVIAGLDREQRA